MSSLIPKEATKTTRVKVLTPGQKAFFVFNSATSAGMTLLPIISGDPAMLLLPAVLVPLWATITGSAANQRLKESLDSWQVTDAPRFPLLRLFGKDKSYKLTKKDKYGQVVNGRYAIGTGSAYILETIPADPLDMWDSSMEAVKEVYSLRSKTEQERELTQRNDYDSGWYSNYDDYDEDYFYDDTLHDRYYRQERARHNRMKKAS